MKTNVKCKLFQRAARIILIVGWALIALAAAAVPFLRENSKGTEEWGQSAEPGYSYEVSGQWELTGGRAVGPTAADGTSVSATLDGGDLVYAFGDARVTLHTKTPWGLFYADGHIEIEFPMEREAKAQASGDVICKFYFADSVEEGVEPEVRAPFRKYYSGEEDMEPFTYESALTRNDRHYAVANSRFPEGQADGETLYVVMDVTDDRNVGVRTLMAWEYRWKSGPITVEVPPEYGPIEYYYVYSDRDILFQNIAVTLSASLPILIACQIILSVLAVKALKKAKPVPAAPTGENSAEETEETE